MSKWRRTSWQQVIVAQASFLEYECKRLCADDHRNRVAGQQPSASASARHASDAAMRHLHDARHAAGFPAREPRMARLANVWSGALVCCAFANLHAAKVVLVDLYAEEDIQAAAPGVLARLQACRPQMISVGKGPKRCSAHRSARSRPIPSARVGLTDKTALSRPNAGRWPLVLKQAAPANSR
jgi:hypothetical protein